MPTIQGYVISIRILFVWSMFSLMLYHSLISSPLPFTPGTPHTTNTRVNHLNSYFLLWSHFNLLLHHSLVSSPVPFTPWTTHATYIKGESSQFVFPLYEVSSVRYSIIRWFYPPYRLHLWSLKLVFRIQLLPRSRRNDQCYICIFIICLKAKISNHLRQLLYSISSPSPISLASYITSLNKQFPFKGYSSFTL